MDRFLDMIRNKVETSVAQPRQSDLLYTEVFGKGIIEYYETKKYTNSVLIKLGISV